MYSSEVLRFGPISIDPGTRHAILEANGTGPRDLDLTRTQFDLLVALLRGGGRVVPRDVLLDSVWGRNRDVGPHAVENAVSELRVKLDPYSGLVQTVRGVGYRLREGTLQPQPRRGSLGPKPEGDSR
jgi:DNA-binding response OmpR family regulator